MAVIRPLEERDWPQVHELVAEVAEAGETYAMDVPATWEETRAFWCGDHLVVAVDGETVLGSAKLGPNRPAQGSHVGTASFMVGSKARGQGIGRALGEYAVEWFRSTGYRGIQFNAVVSTNAAAVRLWQSLGFTVVGTVPDAFLLPDGTWSDLLVMYLELGRPESPAAADVREAVVDAAVRAFPRHGWSGTTYEVLATEAGLTAADVARCFESRADLLIMAFRRVGVPGFPDLPEAFAALELDLLDDVDQRLARLTPFLLSVIRGVSPLVPVLWQAVAEDPVAAALRQGAELRRMAFSRAIVDLLRRGESVSPEAVGAVQTLTTAENYLCLVGLGWTDTQYAAWLTDAIDHAVNG